MNRSKLYRYIYRFSPVAPFGFAAILRAMVPGRPGMALAVEAPSSVTGEQTTWHGVDRHGFMMEATTRSITPFKAPAARHRD
jgi:hypothetical protein